MGVHAQLWNTVTGSFRDTPDDVDYPALLADTDATVVGGSITAAAGGGGGGGRAAVAEATLALLKRRKWEARRYAFKVKGNRERRGRAAVHG